MQFLSKSGFKKIVNSVTLFVKGDVLSTMFILMSILSPLMPKTANAGFFSFISDIGSDKVSAKTIETSTTANSQNMLLLEAPLSSEVGHHIDDNSTILAYGNALSPEIGPQGTAEEVENKVSTEITIYTVREGDSIAKIAEMFDVSVNTIIWANELSKNPSLKEGQTLVILPISGIKYVAKKGDTIRSIVSRYKSNLDEVLQYNDLTVSTVLKAGDIIVIPDAEPTQISTPKLPTPKKPSISGKPGSNLPYYPGYYIRPIVGGSRSQGLHGHNGVDLAAPVGTVIRASAAGKVISSISNGAYNGGYGNYVVISHENGSQTLYAHTQKNFVKVGDTVEQGEMIAKIGMTGKTTGPHIHFEVRGAVNPFGL